MNRRHGTGYLQSEGSAPLFPPEGRSVDEFGETGGPVQLKRGLDPTYPASPRYLRSRYLARAMLAYAAATEAMPKQLVRPEGQGRESRLIQQSVGHE